MPRVHISPSLIVSLLALFFALGGSALAVSSKISPQPRCAQGAVRAVVEVTGQPDHGPANLPDHYTSSTSYLGRHFTCGSSIQVKRTDSGTFYVRLVGNSATSAVASAGGPDPAGATVSRQQDGSFQVIIGSHSAPTDEAFTLVAF
jgi:hypothetical protein